MQNLDWDNLRIVLAIADAGSIVAAARRLGVTHSTVLRRINAFEERLGARIFERMASGYKLTPGGEEIVGVARGVAEQLVALERTVAGRDRRASGTVRLTTTDSLLTTVVMELLPRLRVEHPEIQLEISSASGMLDLAAREADVALRATAKPPDALVGWRLSDLTFAVYGAASSRCKPLSDGEPLKLASKLAWIAPTGVISRSRVGDFFARHRDRFRVEARFDSFRAIHDAIERDIGIGFLPCYFGDSRPRLKRLSPVVDELTIGLWLLTHQDLRAVPRVRAVMDFLNAALTPRKAQFEGRSVPVAAPRPARSRSVSRKA